MGCESCNNLCESRNSCELCVNTEAFCVIGTQCPYEYPNNTFSFSVDPTLNTSRLGPQKYYINGKNIVFNLEVWNEIIDHINSIRTRGNFGASTAYNQRNFKIMSHTEFNDVAEKVGANTRVKSQDLIAGSYFTSLEIAANNYKYNSLQCDRCNTRCQRCDQGCQAHSPSYCCDDCSQTSK